MRPNALTQTDVRARGRFVNVPTALGNQPRGEFTGLGRCQSHPCHPVSAATLVCPDCAVARDEDVGRRWIGDRARERPENRRERRR